MKKKAIICLIIVAIILVGLTGCAENNNNVTTTTTASTTTTTKKTTTTNSLGFGENEKKPIIYIYPEKEMDVTVKLLASNNITVSYPKYTTGWNVVAKPDGTLIDKKTNKELYALYYESNNIVDFDITDEGFVVKGEDTSKFLEEELPLLGLNAKETEEFIIYWLPLLEANKYNYIRFATEEEINTNTPMEITPKPKNIIRVLMTFKGIDKPIDVKEQVIKTPSRTGYTVVEWGGTEIK